MVRSTRNDRSASVSSTEAVATTPLSCYIASFFDTRARLLPVRETLSRLGLEVTSRWLDEPSGVTTAAEFKKCAYRDIEDIKRARFLIIDTLDVTPRGGREVELGYALAWGKPIMLVGPKRNVFHELAGKHFLTWDEALTHIAQMIEHSGYRENRR